MSPSNRYSGLISFRIDLILQSKGLSRVFSNITVQKHQFFSTQLSLPYQFQNKNFYSLQNFYFALFMLHCKHTGHNVIHTYASKPKLTKTSLMLHCFLSPQNLKLQFTLEQYRIEVHRFTYTQISFPTKCILLEYIFHGSFNPRM